VVTRTAKPKEKDMASKTKATVDEAENTDVPTPEVEHYNAIREKEKGVRKLQGEMEDAKAEAALAKKKFDNADQQLRDLIRDGLDPQLKLFGDPDEHSILSALVRRRKT